MKKIFVILVGLTLVLVSGGLTHPKKRRIVIKLKEPVAKKVVTKKVAVTKVKKPSCKLKKVVEDGCLMWQDEPYVDKEIYAYKNETSYHKAGNHYSAKNYCKKLVYNGYRDWRLPTVTELQKIHDKDWDAFSYSRGGATFWTSTPTTMKKYYVVYTVDAFRYVRDVRESNYIRCVRDIN